MSLQALLWARKITAGSSARKAVLLSLAMHHNESRWLAWPSVGRIMAETELCRPTVIKCLQEMEASGLIADSGERAGRTGRVKVWRLAIDDELKKYDTAPENDPEDEWENEATDSPAEPPETENAKAGKQVTKVHHSVDSNGALFSGQWCKKLHPENKRKINPPYPPSKPKPKRRQKPAAEPGREPDVAVAKSGEGLEAWQFRSAVHAGLQKRHGTRRGSAIYNNLFDKCAVHFANGDIVLSCPSPVARDCIAKPEYAAIMKRAAEMAAEDAAIVVKVKPKARKFTQQARAGAARARNGLAMGAA